MHAETDAARVSGTGAGADGTGRRDRYNAVLNAVALVACTVGTHLVLLSGYCPAGRSCLAQGAVGATVFGIGFACAAGALVLGSAVLALGMLCLAVGLGGIAAGTRGAGWVGMVIGGEFFAMGVILTGSRRWVLHRRAGREREDARLWATGRPGRAVVVDVDDDGRRVGRRRIVTLVLRVDPGDGGDRFTVQVERPVEAGERPQPGDLHEVRVDPADPRRLVVGPREPR